MEAYLATIGLVFLTVFAAWGVVAAIAVGKDGWRRLNGESASERRKVA